MIKPDTIVVTPDNLDFPPWRELIKKDISIFGEIFNVFHTSFRGVDYRSFVKSVIPEVYHMDMRTSSRDWRDMAVNQSLSISKSEWVLSYEQDFLPLNDEFFKDVFERAEDYDVVGFNYQNPTKWIKGSRLHPSFLLVRREFVERTNKSFGPAGGLDHFGVFSDELLSLNPRFISLDELGKIEGRDWYHWNGLCHNFSLVQSGQKPNYQLDKFRDYVQRSLNADVEQLQDFVNLCNKCLKETE